jgi:uroporphyrinogen III methyltransferase/synthase
LPREAKVAAIGPATAQRIEQAGLRVDVLPEEYRAEALIEALGAHPLAGERVLIPRAKVAREVLPEKLREAGAEVVVPPAYESVPSTEGKEEVSLRLQSGEIDCVTFTASSTVENFVGAFGAEEAARLLVGTRVACIGPITADTARKHGLRVDAEGKEYTIVGLIEAVTGLLTADPLKRGE